MTLQISKTALHRQTMLRLQSATQCSALQSALRATVRNKTFTLGDRWMPSSVRAIKSIACTAPEVAKMTRHDVISLCQATRFDTCYKYRAAYNCCCNPGVRNMQRLLNPDNLAYIVALFGCCCGGIA